MSKTLLTLHLVLPVAVCLMCPAVLHLFCCCAVAPAQGHAELLLAELLRCSGTAVHHLRLHSADPAVR